MNARGQVVLVVDDEAIIRMHAVDVIGDAGLEAIEANGADEALAILEARQDVTVLFTDIDMPGSMNGLELARRVAETHPSIRLVVTSGKIRPNLAELPEGGRFVPKPYQERVLLELVGT